MALLDHLARKRGRGPGGRPGPNIPRRYWTIAVPVDIAAPWDTFFSLHPKRIRGEFVVELLSRALHAHHTGADSIPISDLLVALNLREPPQEP